MELRGNICTDVTSPPEKAGSVWSCPGLGQTRSLRCSEEEQLRANSCWCSQSDCGGSASSTHFLKPLCASEEKKKRKKTTENSLPLLLDHIQLNNRFSFWVTGSGSEAETQRLQFQRMAESRRR